MQREVRAFKVLFGFWGIWEGARNRKECGCVWGFGVFGQQIRKWRVDAYALLVTFLCPHVLDVLIPLLSISCGSLVRTCDAMSLGCGAGLLMSV